MLAWLNFWWAWQVLMLFWSFSVKWKMLKLNYNFKQKIGMAITRSKIIQMECFKNPHVQQGMPYMKIHFVALGSVKKIWKMNYKSKLKIAMDITCAKIIQIEWFKIPHVQQVMPYMNIISVAHGSVKYFALNN